MELQCKFGLDSSAIYALHGQNAWLSNGCIERFAREPQMSAVRVSNMPFPANLP